MWRTRLQNSRHVSYVVAVALCHCFSPDHRLDSLRRSRAPRRLQWLALGHRYTQGASKDLAGQRSFLASTKQTVYVAAKPRVTCHF